MLTLDHSLSERYRTFVLKAPNTTENRHMQALIDDECFWQRREGKVIRSSQYFPFYRIRPLHAFELIQRLSTSYKILYKERPLIFDFFSALTLELLFQDSTITSFFSQKTRSWLVSECDLILQGPPHIAIIDHFVHFLRPEISWQTVELAKSCPKTSSIEEFYRIQKDTEEETVVCVAFDEPQKTPSVQKPVLKLVDTTLGFANLFIQQGQEYIPCRDKALEQILADAGFIRKEVGSSNYFCPLDRAKQALVCLIEKGWTILDAQGRTLIAATESHLCIDKTPDGYSLCGHISFGSEQISAADCIKAYQQKRALIPLNETSSALLLPKDLHPLGELLGEVELVCDSVHIKKNAIGLIQDVAHAITISPSVQQELDLQPVCVLSGFHGTLRDYQQEGVSWMQALYARGFSGLLADDMGLGKTVQVLAFLSTLARPTRALIVVPTTLLHHWAHEIQTFLPTHTVHVFHGPDRFVKDVDITITSFGIIRQDVEKLLHYQYECIIVDEAQAIKNRQTLAFQALELLSCPFRLSMTGTPIENSVSELIAHFHFLQPGLLPEQTLSPTHIKKKIRPFLLRRKKEDVAKELPEKIEQTLFVTMTDEERTSYDRFHRHWTAGLLHKISLDGAKKHRMQLFEAILRLRQLCCHPALVGQILEAMGGSPDTSASKCDMVLQDIQTILDEGKKVLVFSQFAQMLAILRKEAQKKSWPHLVLDGKTTNRTELVERFQNDPDYNLFFISLKAGGVGLNLTKADYVLLYDPWWNRAQEEQAIDRAHRIGRHETVFARRYVIENTIEERILLLQQKKKALFNHIIEDEDIADDSFLEELVELIHP